MFCDNTIPTEFTPLRNFIPVPRCSKSLVQLGDLQRHLEAYCCKNPAILLVSNVMFKVKSFEEIGMCEPVLWIWIRSEVRNFLQDPDPESDPE
jgi:hypothetical protein